MGLGLLSFMGRCRFVVDLFVASLLKHALLLGVLDLLFLVSHFSLLKLINTSQALI